MDFYKKIEKIASQDQRYKTDAYEFMMQGLWFTQKKLKRQGHVTGRELCEGLKDFGLETYGPMARVVFKHWGIASTSDFGEIVFNMIDNGLMNKSQEDSRQDFKDIYDFEEAFSVFNPKEESGQLE